MTRHKTSSGDSQGTQPYLRGIPPSEIIKFRILRDKPNGVAKWVQIYDTNGQLIYSNKPETK